MCATGLLGAGLAVLHLLQRTHGKTIGEQEVLAQATHTWVGGLLAACAAEQAAGGAGHLSTPTAAPHVHHAAAAGAGADIELAAVGAQSRQ